MLWIALNGCSEFGMPAEILRPYVSTPRASLRAGDSFLISARLPAEFEIVSSQPAEKTQVVSRKDIQNAASCSTQWRRGVFVKQRRWLIVKHPLEESIAAGDSFLISARLPAEFEIVSSRPAEKTQVVSRKDIQSAASCSTQRRAEQPVDCSPQSYSDLRLAAICERRLIDRC